MELIQKGITGALLVGGVGAAGYYASGGPSGITIEDYIQSKKRTLISLEEDWKKKGELYKQVERENLVSGLDNRDRKNKGGVKGVWEFLKEWCLKTQKKYFTDVHDSTYQGFSTWCLSKLTIEEALTKEGFTKEDDYGEKSKSYQEKGENFIPPKPATPKPNPIDKNRMKEWCEEKWKEDFKHEAFGEYARVKEWCFKTKIESKPINP
ncbi:hypothetical protein MHC_05130 [Mycoplasma haemocanis str. Illinois]|uniref:Uncharacterized protein n=1 Tax=Mycoplasma haemocanis (strain Illinois) TaxID=1111676 RepID=H6N8B0_MYCHN|nr:hypothetical protein [Mycoplasma haemocanis]AEW45882.1 hypothetical protein MHC_05130 [Mycoplasma haemocanis str. Illinois]